MISIRFLIRAALVAATATSLAHAAETFPQKPVKIVIPFGAGGLTDLLARAMAADLSQNWGQPVIIENRPGASGSIAATHVAKSPADGLTLLFANDTALSVNPYLYKNLSYDPATDFKPVHNVAGTRNVVLASKASGYQDLQTLLRDAKAKPGTISYGSFGIGSTPHLVTEEIAARAGVELNHIPYNGNADTINALLGGHIDLTPVAIPVALPLIRADKANALGILAGERYFDLPDVPTFEESGIPGLDSRIYFGLVAPVGTPDEVVQAISRGVAEVIRQPEFKERQITSKGMELIDQDPAEFAVFLEADRKRYETRIRAMNLSLD
ncbi:MAG: tripartite tricarboxylate transporter substrate binding protein [Pigmentiphaga sp.]|nr:tripartite tricarboxylate transporter substrate binding protein [Pigmentiphaga sp.]